VSDGRRRRGPKFALALPSWVWYLAFFVVPLAFIIVYSFGYKPPVNTSSSSIGLDRLSLDNYRNALEGSLFDVFTRTLRISILGTALCLIIAFPMAYFLAVKVPQRWRGLLLGLVIVPFWTSFLIRTVAWRIVLSSNGLLSHWMQTVGLRDTPIKFLDTREAVQLGVVYNYLPLMIFPLFVALDRLDPALREASKDLGASRLRTFAQVTLPLAMPGVVAGLLLVFIPLSGDYITASVLGGTKGNMVGAMVASQFQSAQNWAQGSAMSVLLILMILACIVVAGTVALVGRTIVRRVRSIEIKPPPVPGSLLRVEPV
jgi:spermidine/putrescine transport system permease protein